jgi:hypothetical protein
VTWAHADAVDATLCVGDVLRFALRGCAEAPAALQLKVALLRHGAERPLVNIQLPVREAAAGADDAPQPWRAFVRLLPGDCVLLRHAVDGTFPEPTPAPA